MFDELDFNGKDRIFPLKLFVFFLDDMVTTFWFLPRNNLE